MEQFIADYKRMEKDGTHPILIASFLHDRLVEIHPFIDGNGRTSRLLMNLYLLSKGYIIATLKGDNEARYTYYTALEKSHTEQNRDTFDLLVANTVKKSMEKYLSVVE